MNENPGRRYSQTIGVMAKCVLSVCSDCGAVVANEQWHDDYHAKDE